MSDDARFEDADTGALRLAAEEPDGLSVISSLCQDAVLTAADVSWMPKKRRVAILLSRFRWEDKAAAARAGRPFERVRSMLTIDSALSLKSSGVTPGDGDTVLSVLSVAWEASGDPEDPSGRVVLTLAGDGAVVAAAECLDVRLADVARPHRAVSGKAPGHDI